MVVSYVEETNRYTPNSHLELGPTWLLLNHTSDSTRYFRLVNVPLSRIFLSFRWKVEPFSNNKFQKLNSFSRFLLRFFEFGNVQIRLLGQLSFLTEHSFHYEILVWWRRIRYLCSFRLNINTVNTTIFLVYEERTEFTDLVASTQRKTEKFSFKYFVCHVFPTSPRSLG